MCVCVRVCVLSAQVKSLRSARYQCTSGDQVLRTITQREYRHRAQQPLSSAQLVGLEFSQPHTQCKRTCLVGAQVRAHNAREKVCCVCVRIADGGAVGA